MRVNISKEEQSSGFDIAFPGTYDAVIVGKKDGTGPKGPYIRWDIDLQGVQQNAEGLPLNGKKVSYVREVTTLAEGQKWRLSQLAKACGLDPNDFDTDDIVGKRVVVQIDVEKDDPKYPARNCVKKFVEA